VQRRPSLVELLDASEIGLRDPAGGHLSTGHHCLQVADSLFLQVEMRRFDVALDLRFHRCGLRDARSGYDCGVQCSVAKKFAAVH